MIEFICSRIRVSLWISRPIVIHKHIRTIWTIWNHSFLLKRRSSISVEALHLKIEVRHSPNPRSLTPSTEDGSMTQFLSGTDLSHLITLLVRNSENILVGKDKDGTPLLITSSTGAIWVVEREASFLLAVELPRTAHLLSHGFLTPVH